MGVQNFKSSVSESSDRVSSLVIGVGMGMGNSNGWCMG